MLLNKLILPSNLEKFVNYRVNIQILNVICHYESVSSFQYNTDYSLLSV